MKTFANIGIRQDVLKGLSLLGFQEPTPIQSEVIPLMLEQQVDLVSLAQTGTGKTAAFGLPMIQLTDTGNRQTQSLVLCPTRELCVQVTRDMQAFSKFVKGLKVLAIYGGSSIERQVAALRKGVQIIVATPGRLNDLIKRGKVDISEVRTVVFDEADEMLQMGFQDELNAILSYTPAQKNTLLFSATMSKEVARIARKYMSDPVEVTVGKRNAGAENVSHEYYMVHARDRYPALKRIVDFYPDNYSIIFCRTRQETQEVADKLMQDGYSADALHGDLSQAQRDQVMKKFRSRNLEMLVATDVAARGLDVNDLTHVINYNLPDDISNYTHRSGRTGRAGRNGKSIAIVHLKERYRIKAIENKINKRFKQCSIPSGAEVCRNQLLNLVDKVQHAEMDYSQADSLYAEISQQLESLDREELIRKFVSFELNKMLDYYKYAPDLNVSDKEKKKHGKKERRLEKNGRNATRKPRFTRFFLNVGRRDGIIPQELIGRLNSVPGGGRIKVGKIEIMRNSAMLEADSKFAPQVLDAFRRVKINGKSVSIELSRNRRGTKNQKKNESRRRKGRSISAA